MSNPVFQAGTTILVVSADGSTLPANHQRQFERVLGLENVDWVNETWSPRQLTNASPTVGDLIDHVIVISDPLPLVAIEDDSLYPTRFYPRLCRSSSHSFTSVPRWSYVPFDDSKDATGFATLTSYTDNIAYTIVERIALGDPVTYQRLAHERSRQVPRRVNWQITWSGTVNERIVPTEYTPEQVEELASFERRSEYLEQIMASGSFEEHDAAVRDYERDKRRFANNIG